MSSHTAGRDLLLNGFKVSTVAIDNGPHGWGYVSEVRHGSVCVARAKNTEGFRAGVAHGAYVAHYSTIPEVAIPAIVEEARRTPDPEDAARPDIDEGRPSSAPLIKRVQELEADLRRERAVRRVVDKALAEAVRALKEGERSDT